MLWRSQCRADHSTGGAPRVDWRKGFVTDQPVLCTQGAIALIKVLSELDYAPPRVIAVSTMGLREDHHNLPYLLQASPDQTS